MSKITCAISGITYQCEHVPLVLIDRECAHPIFYTSQVRLLRLYKKYTSNHLTPTDSYLLFLAILHSTDNISFATACTLDPSAAQTTQIIASNIHQLIDVIWQTNAIVHPSFKQPSYIIRASNSDLKNIHNWIKAWKRNIELFKIGEATAREAEQLTKIENKLLLIIRRGIDDITLSSCVAEWASKAAAFPPEHNTLWKKTIRSCFNPKIMFNTPRALIQEIKNYCEDNILIGSSHFHTLTQVLKEGYKNHIDYLGNATLESMGSLSSSATTFTLCKGEESTEEANLNYAVEEAPTSSPVRNNYSSLTEFIKARSKYMLATSLAATSITDELTPEEALDAVNKKEDIKAYEESIANKGDESMSRNITLDDIEGITGITDITGIQNEENN